MVIHGWSKIIGQMSYHRKYYISPAVELFLPCSMVRKHIAPTLPSKLIQVILEDDQRRRQIQNPMPSPSWHTPKPMVIFMPSWRQSRGDSIWHEVVKWARFFFLSFFFSNKIIVVDYIDLLHDVTKITWPNSDTYLTKYNLNIIMYNSTNYNDQNQF